MCVWWWGGESCSNLVQVSWHIKPLSESIHSKAKLDWFIGGNWRPKKKKKEFFKLRTVYTSFSGGQEAQESGEGDRTMGWVISTHVLTFLSSHTD